MARKFRVTIGGITYNVEVEEVGATGAPAPAFVSAPAPAPQPVVIARSAAPAPSAPAPSPAATPAPRTEVKGPGDVVRAPLPGMVVGVRAAVGQQVKAGDVILVLEAMKMENDIVAPVNGTIKEILVDKGSAVSLGDALVVLG